MFARMDLQNGTPEVTLHSIPEVAARLSISQRSVYNLISRGDLRPVDIGTTRTKTRVRSDDLARYIDARTRTVPSRTEPLTAVAAT
jgi:excisionase family DNA binding protein